MRKHLYIALLLLAQATIIHGQEVSGKIVDNGSQLPITFAHIYNPTTGAGTISNEDGKFNLNQLNFSKNDSLIITHVNYHTLVFRTSQIASDTILTLYLTPATTKLDELVVESGKALEIVEKVIEQLKTSKVQYGKGFYRQIYTKDGNPMEWIESFYDLSYSQNGVDKVKIKQARFARKKYDTTNVFMSHTNFSALALTSSLYSPISGELENRVAKPFGLDFTDFYNFRIAKKYEKEGNTYYVVEFFPSDEMPSKITSSGKFIYNYEKEIMLEFEVVLYHDLGMGH